MAWNGSDGKTISKNTEKGPDLKRGLLAGGLVVILVVVGLFWFKGKPTTVLGKTDKRQGKIVEAAPALRNVSDETVMSPTESAQNVGTKEILEKVDKALLSTNNVIVVSNMVNDANYKSDFSSGIEQVMSWIFTTELGSAPPPMPYLSPREKKKIAEIILDKNPVDEGDSEATRGAKEIVALAKKELASYLKDGGDIEGFLDYYRAELIKANEEYRDAQKLVREVAKEGDDEVTLRFAETVNQKLAERGIKSVVLPARLRHQLQPKENQE